MTKRILNLADECGPLLGGAEIAQGQCNLKLTIETALSFGKGRMWALRVEKPRWNDNGRSLKARHVLTLIVNDGETPADLLRSLANAWEQGDVEING